MKCMNCGLAKSAHILVPHQLPERTAEEVNNFIRAHGG